MCSTSKSQRVSIQDGDTFKSRDERHVQSNLGLYLAIRNFQPTMNPLLAYSGDQQALEKPGYKKGEDSPSMR